jgi:hypothetical protein
MNDVKILAVILSHAAATLYMTGLIWFVQIVHHPLMSSIQNEDFANYEQQHMSLTTWVVAPPMLIEVATAVLLFWFRPTGVSSTLGLLPGRSTYVIDKEGIVRLIFSAQFASEKHVQQALNVVASHG